MADDLADLRAELLQLRTELASVRAQLDAARLHHAPTMRARLRCPACGNARLAHANHVRDLSSATARPDGPQRLALAQPAWASDTLVGQLEVHACTGCGFVEWYVSDPGALREVKGHITITDDDSGTPGPYR